ncbi:MAG: heavy metal translocating P-type ATPase [Verrucomicrobiaceae bacterium]|nr:heavy metal translocating P-type ATPase [Verrucomicrobiaceae bacterium]
MSCCCHAVPSKPKAGKSDSGPWAVLAVLIVLSGLVMNVNLAVNVSAITGDARLLVHGVLAMAGLLAIGLGGRDLLQPAWRALCERRIVTEHLFIAGILAAWGVSVHATLTGRGPVFYEVPVLLPAIRRFGTLLLARQRSGVEAAAREMLAGISVARVWNAGDWEIMPLASVVAGQQLLIKAGETLPVDAVLVEGRAYVQTRTLTGEPFPMVPATGERVCAGTVVLDGDLQVRATGSVAGSEVSRLAAATQALLERPPVFLGSVQTVLSWFFPAVLGVSATTCAFWAWREGWQAAIDNSLAVVLVACPCAFGVALPLLYRRGLSSCLQRGIEPADGGFMESLAQVKVIAFDKTGTLTTPEMTVGTLHYAAGVDEQFVRSVLAALHSRSTHPVARPFWQWAAEGQGMQVRHLQPLPGRGVEAEVFWREEWHNVRLGNEAACTATMTSWVPTKPGKRCLFLEVDAFLTGVCELDEDLRSSAATACASLGTMGYRIALLTGDTMVPNALQPVFDELHTAQRPEEKAARVGQWQQSGLPVLFIGDGLNDSQALATAIASVAVGEDAGLAGTAQARWRNPNFAALPGLCGEARTMAARGHLILRVALTYNGLGMAIAACGMLHPVAATVLMLVSSATVTALASFDSKRKACVPKVRAQKNGPVLMNRPVWDKDPAF